MSRVVSKLFRKPEDAEKVLAELRSKGYRAEEIGIVVSEKSESDGVTSRYVSQSQAATLPVSGIGIAIGATAAALGSSGEKDPEAALSKLWGIPAETFNYYRCGISL